MITGLIASAAAKLIGWGLPAKFAKPVVNVLLIASLIGIAIAAWNIWLSQRDQDVIDRHEAEVNMKVESAVRGADGEAADQRRDDDSRAAAEAGELQKVNENDPDKDKPATGSQRDYLRCIKLQQQARAAGNPAPACRRSAN